MGYWIYFTRTFEEKKTQKKGERKGKMNEKKRALKFGEPPRYKGAIMNYNK